MVRGAGHAVRGDHGQGVQQGEAVLRAELRGPGRARLVAPHHAARVLLDAREWTSELFSRPVGRSGCMQS